eukprot:5881638-Pleurochrysis_carterae.AAC.1
MLYACCNRHSLERIEFQKFTARLLLAKQQSGLSAERVDELVTQQTLKRSVGDMVTFPLNA